MTVSKQQQWQNTEWNGIIIRGPNICQWNWLFIKIWSTEMMDFNVVQFRISHIWVCVGAWPIIKSERIEQCCNICEVVQLMTYKVWIDMSTCRWKHENHIPCTRFNQIGCLCFFFHIIFICCCCLLLPVWLHIYRRNCTRSRALLFTSVTCFNQVHSMYTDIHVRIVA